MVLLLPNWILIKYIPGGKLFTNTVFCKVVLCLLKINSCKSAPLLLYISAVTWPFSGPTSFTSITSLAGTGDNVRPRELTGGEGIGVTTGIRWYCNIHA